MGLSIHAFVRSTVRINQLKMFGSLALGGVALLAVAAIAQQPLGFPANNQQPPANNQQGSGPQLTPPAVQPVPSSTGVETRAYPVPADQLQATAVEWKQKLGPSASIAVDPRSSRILVSGPPAIHQVLQGQPVANRNTNPAVNPAATTTQTQLAAQQQAEPTQYQLKRIDAAALLTNLQRMWGERVSVSNAQDRVTSYVIVNSATGNRPVLATNSQASTVTFYGTTSQQRAWRIVTEALDVGGNAESTTQLVPTAKADPMQVRQAVAWLQNGGPNTSQIRFGGGMLPLIFGQQPPANGAVQPPNNGVPNNGVPNNGVPGANPNQANPNDPNANPANPNALADGVPVGDVQVEFIEGLDLMVLRGRKADVERITRVIQEIERVSNETRPEIKVRYLKHANSEAVAEIITTVYENLLTTRLGETSVTGLGKPNAILIVGRTENMPVVEDLIAKLDQPVPFPMQFEAFQLRNMSAVDMSAALTTAFEEPTALATRIRVTPIFRSNIVVVQASQRDMLEVGRLILKLDIRESSSVSEVKVFRLQNTLAEDLAPLLQDAINWQLTGDGTPLGSQGGGAGNNQEERARLRSTMLQFLTVDSGGNRLLKSGILSEVRVTADIAGNAVVVTGPSESMTLIAALIKELDSLPSASAQVKVFTIINGDAARLSLMLQTMFGQTTNQGQQAQGGLGQLGLTTGAGANESSLAPLRFGVDERTNSIVVSGSEGDLNVIEALLLRLDEAELGNRKTTVYRLANTQASLVAASITDLLNNQRQILSQRQQQFNLLSAYEQVDSEVFVVAEDGSNSIIISATPRFYDEIITVIESLDRKPAVIKIDVLIAEVQLNDDEEFGVELGLQDSLLFDRSVADGATQVPGFAFNNQGLGNSNSAGSLATRGNLAGQALSTFGVGRTSANLGYGGLVLSAANESVSILVRALRDSGRLQVLSRPQVTALENQPAFVLVGQRVPRITDTTLTNQGTTNSVVLDNVGLQVNIAARVTPDNTVVMEVATEKSSVGPIAEGIPISINANGDVINSPIFNVTEAQTFISARDGQTIVMAGLITKDRSTVKRRVPFLSDIPIVGNLFRFDAFSESRTELLMILTPHVMKSDEEVDWHTYSESERMSWCLADVMEMYDAPVLSGGHGGFATETPVIYPDQNPTGAAETGVNEFAQPINGGSSVLYPPVSTSSNNTRRPVLDPAGHVFPSGDRVQPATFQNPVPAASNPRQGLNPIQRLPAANNGRVSAPFTSNRAIAPAATPAAPWGVAPVGQQMPSEQFRPSIPMPPQNNSARLPGGVPKQFSFSGQTPIGSSPAAGMANRGF